MNTSIPYQNTNIAVISNQLAKASYALSVTEHRLVKSFLKRLDNYYDKEHQALSYIFVKDYAEDWGLVITDARKEAKAAIVSLFKKKLTLLQADGESYLDVRWISESGYDRETDTIMLTWTTRVLLHISLLQERFTKLDLLEIKDFKSNYSFRLYEILICSIGENSYRNPKFLVEDLMNLLDIPRSYRNYMTFKQKVLTPCTKELQTKTGKFSKLEFKEGKLSGSKKVVSIEFTHCGVGNRYKKEKGARELSWEELEG